jgi:hypothetical protein
MNLYSERHGIRKAVKRTSDITVEMYSLLWDICERYFENVAWKFPESCPDGYGCCGLDWEKFDNNLRFEIPDLFRDSNGRLTKPNIQRSSRDEEQAFDQYALLDFIEYIAINCQDITSRSWHSFFQHDHLGFDDETYETGDRFRAEINNAFVKTGLLYTLTEAPYNERITDNSVLTMETKVHKGIKFSYCV